MDKKVEIVQEQAFVDNILVNVDSLEINGSRAKDDKHENHYHENFVP